MCIYHGIYYICNNLRFIMLLDGKKVYLKEFTTNHLNSDDYFRWLRDIDVINTIGRDDYLLNTSKDEIFSYVNSILNSKNNCFFAIYEKNSNKFIGTQKIGHINWKFGTADLGIMIGDKSCWQKGYASETITIAKNYAFDFLNLRKLTGGNASHNIAMSKIFINCGFSEEGRLRKQGRINGNYYDLILYGLLVEDYRK